MTNENSQNGMLPPYIPYRTFVNSLDAFIEGVPPIVDKTAWKSQAGSVQTNLIKAYKFFGLTDESSQVQPVLRDLIASADRKQGIRKLIEEHYPKIVELAANNATSGQLDDAMRNEFGYQGDTLRKAIAFFVQAANDTGIKVSPHWPGANKKATGMARRKTGATKKSQQPKGTSSETPAPLPTPPAGALSVPVHPMLSGSIQWLYENGKSWADDAAETWCDSFIKMVKLVYPPTTRRMSTPPAPRRVDGRQPSSADNALSGGFAEEKEAVGA